MPTNTINAMSDPRQEAKNVLKKFMDGRLKLENYRKKYGI
jgi:hypothetical protein